MTHETPDALLRHSACSVVLKEPGVLVCEVFGSMMNVALVLVGALFVLSAFSRVPLFIDSSPEPLMLILASIGSLAFGWFLIRRFQKRKREISRFEIDQTQRVIQDMANGDVWAFDDVARVYTVADLTDGTRLDLFPSYPRWLMVIFKDGRRIRLAKGGRKELAPVLQWLSDAGLPAVPTQPTT